MGQLCLPTVTGNQIRRTVLMMKSSLSLPTQTLGEWAQLTFSVWVKASLYSGNGYPAFIGSYADTDARNIYLGIKQSSSKFTLGNRYSSRKF